MKPQEVQRIRGYVQALPRVQGQEDAAKVAVVTEDGTEYHVLHKSAGMDLVDYISADVEVQGHVDPMPKKPESGSESGNDADPNDAGPAQFLLVVRSYQLADGYDDPWYDDDV